jgi:ribosomal protein S18 acetylase RimI-like enzyme
MSETQVPPTVRDSDPELDQAWAEAAVAADLGSALQARRGALLDVLALPGLVAERNGERLGLLLYQPDDGSGEAELAALVTPVRRAGAGAALVAALRERLPYRSIWVVTTNDNLDALRFYQRREFRIREVRVGAVDAARRSLKATIPTLGAHGIPMRDEVELVLDPPERPEPG